ncbi:NADH-quinone oxidoreductase subunit L [Arenimonas caeni]|jgi:NADH-quinone oxidoreductase subunit L|uniref:NADH-quinone oxidoreductase subunit L n=1 Tax=Arenimonas caeni TaxID=2058085 RepID=UPI002A35E78B|nr:NADH-quinone oxidoreductase subunit L [Arenimonas caeni]MDY0021794.1 NADH-quinone oxidoreductase subunit L [Arenimonas caeni]
MISMNILLVIALAPLAGSAIAGLFGKQVGRAGAHWVTILGVAVSCALSVHVLWQFLAGGATPFNENVYTFFQVGGYSAHVGFMVDTLTAMMMVVVTFVSLLVHVYTIGYMAEDPGYQRFFSYISLFTFSMLMLVMSNNFLQLFFGWEAVGLVSYLLIGFWYKRPTAIFANLKAFLVNRVGDFGFLLGIAGVLAWVGTLDYATVFAHAYNSELQSTFTLWSGKIGFGGWSIDVLSGPVQVEIMTFICICLFIGAMGKSAQVPLHVWLPDSMEGPTPISALIHAATMVTAGIFMVARMSPLFEQSETALAFVLFVGATTAFFTGLIGIVQNDIKRVVAYSTLSQLGYMTVALGVSAYSAAVFHLMTHAFFKALLFLAAGSVIIGMHHEQDMRRMGGLKKYMPITYWTSLIGTLALVGTPFLSGYFSKDTIIIAAQQAAEQGGWVQQYGYYAVLLGVFVTAFYSFRLLYLTFHGKERFREVAHDAHHGDDDHGHHGPVEPHESPWVVTVPLVLLAIPSIFIGFFTVGPMLFGDFFRGAIEVMPAHDTVARAGEILWHDAHGWFSAAVGFGMHFYASIVFWLAFAGFALATYIYLFSPALADRLAKLFAPVVRILENKYGFDDLWIKGFAGGGIKLGRFSWKKGDAGLIDGLLVNGSAALVDRVAGLVRHIQTGRLYNYAFAMILGLIVLLAVLVKMTGA